MTIGKSRDSYISLQTTKSTLFKILTRKKSEKVLEKVIPSIPIDAIFQQDKFSVEFDYQCYAVVKKIIARSQDVWKVFLLTAGKHLVCVEVVDKGFIEL